MHRSLTTWQIAGKLALVALIAGGAAALVVAWRRRRRGDPSARALAIIGAASLVAGAFAYVALGDQLASIKD